MSVSLNGTNGLTFADSTTQNTGGYTGFRNRIINGDMRIDQRNAGASVTPSIQAYTVDRFLSTQVGGGAFSIQRSTTVPTGFTNSAAMTVTTADASIASGDVYTFEQRIEGFNFADLGWGTSAAQSATLSFWVRSSVTGIYAGGLKNSANNRSYVFTYAISSANTWEYKTISVTGDTTGTWLTDSGIGVQVLLDLGSGSTFNGTADVWQAANAIRTSGSVNWIATSGATFYITGVQLEAGSVATPFERRPYGTELALCQRYFEIAQLYSASAGGGTRTDLSNYSWHVTKRASPTLAVFGTPGVQTGTNTISTNGHVSSFYMFGAGIFLGSVSGTAEL